MSVCVKGADMRFEVWHSKVMFDMFACFPWTRSTSSKIVAGRAKIHQHAHKWIQPYKNKTFSRFIYRSVNGIYNRAYKP